MPNPQTLLREIEVLKKENKQLKSRKRYGLVWEDKPEDVVEQCKKELPILEEVKSKAIKKEVDTPTNFLIEGDNYHALSVLNYTHARKVDVIYIDPPYNTGAKDWKYNNHFVDSKDAYRHSKWLSMMAKRIVLAKKLLKPDGVMIVAIDDNEAHHLRTLLEEIMPGYDITSITIVHNPRGNITNNFARTHEYALYIIPKRLSAIPRIQKTSITPRKLRRWGHNSTRVARPTMFYPIYVSGDKITRIGEVPSPDFHPDKKNIQKNNGEIEVWPIDQDGVERRWNFGLDSVSSHLERMVAINIKGQLDIFLTEEDTTPKTVWTESDLEAGRNGASLVKAITGVSFPFPKSIYTVLKCVGLVVRSRPNAVVLDFFAGSGTTGHAVMMLNKEDGGKRQFILCTNNENNIAEEVTYPRISQVIKGVKDLEDLTGIPANFRYFKTNFIDAEPTDRNKKKLVDKSTEMLCLKEDCFVKVSEGDSYKIFKNNEERYLGIIYDDIGIKSFKKEAEKLGKKFIVYVFSLDESAREDEFEDIQKLVELKPVPIAIFNLYKRIFK